MDIVLEVIGWLFYIFILLVAFSSFIYGGKLILDIEEVSVGKYTSRLIAVIIAIVFFFRADQIPYIEDLFPIITIENVYFSWGFSIIACLSALLCGIGIYKNRQKEWEKIKHDRKMFGVIILFVVSSLCFGYIA